MSPTFQNQAKLLTKADKLDKFFGFVCDICACLKHFVYYAILFYAIIYIFFLLLLLPYYFYFFNSFLF